MASETTWNGVSLECVMTSAPKSLLHSTHVYTDLTAWEKVKHLTLEGFVSRNVVNATGLWITITARSLVSSGRRVYKEGNQAGVREIRA